MPDVHLPIPFDAYDGTEPFIFVSYAHKDGRRVYPELKRLHEMGYRIWYDEGIDPGNEWPEEIAKALGRAALFLVFISENAIGSKNVKNEINFALNRDKPFLAIHLQEVILPDGLELRMGDIQAIMMWRIDETNYLRKIRKSLPVSLKEPERTASTPASHGGGTKRSTDLELAAGIHEFFSKLIGGQGHQSKELEDFDDLTDVNKRENIAAARRMKGFLDLVHLKIAPASETLKGEEEQALAILENNLELLAASEHGFWKSEKERNGWTYHKVRDQSLRRHNMLLPYHELTTSEQDKSRNGVRMYPDMVATAGYRIVPENMGVTASAEEECLPDLHAKDKGGPSAEPDEKRRSENPKSWFTARGSADGTVDYECRRCDEFGTFEHRDRMDRPPAFCPRCGLGADEATSGKERVHVAERWRVDLSGSQALDRVAWNKSTVYLMGMILSPYEGYTIKKVDRASGEILETDGGFVDPNDAPPGKPRIFVPEESFPEYPDLSWERVESKESDSPEWAWLHGPNRGELEFVGRSRSGCRGSWSAPTGMRVAKVMPLGRGDLIVVLDEDRKDAAEAVLINLS